MTTETVGTILDLLAQLRARDAQIVTLQHVVSVALELLAQRDKELAAARARLDAMREELRWLMTGDRPSERDAAA